MLDRSGWTDLALTIAACAFLGWVLAAVFSPGAFSSPEQVNSLTIGRLVAFQGNVRRRIEGVLVWEKLRGGEFIYENDSLYATQGAQAAVRLGDGSEIRVDERSLVVLKTRRYGSGTTDQPGGRGAEAGASLGADAVVMSVQIKSGAAQGIPGRHRLELQSGETRVQLDQGARAELKVSKKKATHVSVVEGRVGVATVSGDHELSKGQMQTFDVQGRRIGAVQDFAIDLLHPTLGGEVFVTPQARGVELAWSEVPGKGPYIVEIGPSLNRLEKLEVIGTSTSLENLPIGRVVWRVGRSSSESPKGRVRSAAARFYVVRDLPPEPYRPKSGELVDLSESAGIPFAWIGVPGVQEYDLELSPEQDIRSPVVATQIGQASQVVTVDPKLLDEGMYCYRIRSRAIQRVAPWSKQRCFRIVTRPVLRAPTLFEPSELGEGSDKERGQASPEQGWLWWLFLGSVAHAASGEPVTLRWEQIPGAVGYEVEIGLDAEFESSILFKRVNEPYLKWVPAGRQTFYWRVRAVDREGRQGYYSSPKVLDLKVPRPSLVDKRTQIQLHLASGGALFELRWEAAKDLNRFEVELAADEGFSAQLHRLSVTDKRETALRLQLGTHYLRVFSIDSEGWRSRPTEALKVMVVAPIPRLTAPAPLSKVSLTRLQQKVHLRWAGGISKRYEVLLTREGEAEKQRLTVRGNEVSVRLGALGAYFVRVRGHEPSTAWGKAHRFEVIPQKISLTTPKEDAAIEVRADGTELVEFRWEPVVGVHRYRLSVGEQQRVTRGVGAWVPLKPGNHRWQVAPISERGLEFSEQSRGRNLVLESRTVDEAHRQKGTLVHKSRTPGEENDFRSGWLFLAPRAAMHTNMGTIFAPRVSLELSTPFWLERGMLWVSMSVGYFSAATEFEGGGVEARSRLHGFPIDALVRWGYPVAIGGQSFRFFVGGGLELSMGRSTLRVGTQRSLSERTIGVGGVATGGVSWLRKRGELFFDVLYGFFPEVGTLVDYRPGGLTLALGFRFEIL